MPQYLKEHGERLIELGYTVVPIKPGTKRPDLTGWQNHETTAADVVKWYSNGRASHGAGINARRTPAIDVDVMDKEIADAMSDAIDRIFPGVALLTRTGLAPKFLIPFRCAEPFRKLISNVYTDGKNEHKVEILGDGQQWVAYHIHPDTGKPYQWWDGLGNDGISTVERNALPCLTGSDAQRVIDAFEIFASERVVVGKWVLRSAPAARKDVTPVEDPFGEQPVGKTESEVSALLARHPNNEADYDHWFAVLAAVHHEMGDAGRELALDWSSSSTKHGQEKFDTTWNSLGRYTGRQITLRSLLKASPLPTPAQPHPQASEGDPVPFADGAQFAAGFEDVEWIVEDVVPRAQVGVIYGASGSGKTFFALDLACSIHRGTEWRGKHVEQADTFYIAAEAGAGIKKRIAAYLQKHGEGSMPWFVDYQPNLALLESVKDISASVKLRSRTPGVIFIDTLALSHDGDENSSKDMSLVLRNCKTLAENTGCVVVLVHHTGKDDSKGMRGSSVTYAGSDFVLEISSSGRDHAMLVDKLKDGERGAQFGFTLPAVEVGRTPRGKAITSCYVGPSSGITPKGARALVVPAQIFIRDVFLASLGTEPTMSETELVEAVKAKQRERGDTPSQSQSIKGSIGKLINSGHFCKVNEKISLPENIAWHAHLDHLDSFE